MFSMKRTVSLLLALLMILSCSALALISCDNGSGNDTSSADSSASEAPESTPGTEADPAESDAFDLVIKGEANVKVIRHQDLDSSNPQVKAAMTIRKQLVESTGANIKIEDDWIKRGDEHDPSTLEILVGDTNYNETAEAKKDLKYGDFLVRVIGNKIVVLGYTDEAIAAAASALCKTIIAYTTQDEGASTFSLTIKKAFLQATGTKNNVISNMPKFDGTFSAYYEGGLNTDELIFEDATVDSYNAYLQKLIDAGYKKHTDHSIKANTFTTLYNDSYTITAGYYDYNKNVRIMIQPFAPQSLLATEAENVTETVTTGQITMIGLEYTKSSGGYASNGLSILIRLTDGRFIVVDGGFSGSQTDADMLLAQMKAQSAEYVAKTGGIKVAAWIITHSHGDHNGMINSKSSTFKNAGVTVERFIVNFLSEKELVKSRAAYSGNWSDTEGGGWSSTLTSASNLGAEVVTARVGQVFYLANAKLEVLYTIDSYAPKAANALNTTSLIIKMTFTDPVTKKETVYMSTGDATGPGFLICFNMYGDYLKSDIVQVAHHGYTTWGTENGTISAYKLMAPPTLLWPQGEKAYPNYKDKSYNAVLWNASNPNYQETLVAGWEGSITIFPLPYTVGSAIVNAKHSS